MDAHVPYIKWQRKGHTVGPPTSTDSQPQIKNTYCFRTVVGSTDAKPTDKEGQLYYLLQKICLCTSEPVQTDVVHGSTA